MSLMEKGKALMPVSTDTADVDNVVSLKGTPDNPAREMTANGPASGPGSIGDTAFKDAVIIVSVAWLFLLFLALSLRHHNI